MNRLLTLSERPVLDLEQAHFTHTVGGILVIGTWYMDRETREAQPCLVLLDAARRLQRKRVIPCIVLLEDMWRWTVEMGDRDFVARNISDWLNSGALPGSATNKKDVFRVMDAVQSRLRDIVTMPPLPPKAAIKHGAASPVGELIITERDTGKTVQEIEVVTGHVSD